MERSLWEDGVGGVSAMVGYELPDLTKQVGCGLVERDSKDRPGVRGRGRASGTPSGKGTLRRWEVQQLKAEDSKGRSKGQAGKSGWKQAGETRSPVQGVGTASARPVVSEVECT